MSRIIGLDVGTSSVKALLIENDKIINQHSVGYTPDFLGDGYVEQDPIIWWEATKGAIKGVLAQYPGKIDAISASGQMHSSVFLDKDGNVVRKAILWNDVRTTPQVEYIKKTIEQKKLIDLVSNIALEGFTLPKVLWLKQNEPQNYEKVAKVIMPKDYINYKLTGRIATELSDAAGTIMLSVKERQWNKELLGIFGIDPELLPDLLESIDIVGSVLPEIAESIGLSSETLVAAGGADNSCAAIGTGVIKTGQATISIGTSGTVVAQLDSVPENLTGSVHLFNYSAPKKFYAMGCMLSAGESLNWLKSIIPVDDFNEFNKMAETSQAGSNGVVFLPYLFGERCPYPDPEAKGVFFGLKRTTTQSDIVRAVMEGVSFNIKAMFDLVQGFSDITEIFITGGGAKSPIWGQIIADILERPIQVLNVEEGPAFGAALIAGVGAKIYSDFQDAASRFIKVEKIIQPVKREEYPKQFEKFKKIYEANKGLF